MPSNWPVDTTAHAVSDASAIPYFRTTAFTAGFFTVLALLLIAGRFAPVVPTV